MKTVRIKILDRDLTVRSDEEEKIRAIADYLNRQLNLTKDGSPVLNTIDLFIMTAFRIASDYFQLREDLEVFKEKIDVRADDLAAMIDRNLVTLDKSDR